MTNFTATLPADMIQIEEWLKVDDSKKSMDSAWWLTGANCVLAFCVSDQGGPLMYVRMDGESEYARMHTLFAPTEQVSKSRIAAGLVEGFPVLRYAMKEKGFKGIVFESTSKSLISFMERAGFKARPDVVDDYVLVFPQEK